MTDRQRQERTPSIMVVDDEAIVAQTIESFLTLETDYNVSTFTSPTAAIEALTTSSFDLVVSDFLMPEMNGLEFLTRAKRLHPDMVRILLTGYADRDNAVRAINEVGLFQYLEKPWENDQLLLVIKNGLAHKRLSARLTEKVGELDRTLRDRDRIAQRHNELQEELRLARRIQEHLLPSTFPSANGMKFFAKYLPALEVGGDFYDVIPLSGDSVGVMIADVTGHGIQAALSTTVLKSVFSEFANEDAKPAEILERVNTVLYRILPDDVFAAASVASVNTRSGVVSLANGGGPHPFHLKRGQNTVESVIANGLLVGVVEPELYRVEETAAVELAPGDGLLFYTDGLSDAESPEGRGFGEIRMREYIIEHQQLPAEKIGEALVAEARRFTAPEHAWDDITMLGLDRAG